MAYKDMPPHARITAVHFDIMRDPEFALLGGVTQIGKVFVDELIPTAGTDGRDVHYGKAFISTLDRKQLRYLVAHENLHKALHHCTEYVSVCKKYPRESNMAMDHCVNLMIEEMDAGRGFVQRPTDPAPLVDAKYKDWSFLEVLRDLLKNPPPQPQGGQGGQGRHGQAGAGTLDEHTIHQPGSGEPSEKMSQADAAELNKLLQDAVNQGKIVRDKLRGEGKGGANLSGFQQRSTDWRTPLRRFVMELCEGDDQSRYCPPNKRMQPLGILLPSHFSESTGELIVACDTSGSMGGVYPVVFGELCRIAQNANPKKLRVIWWDTAVHSEQVFTEKDYGNIKNLLKPKGGGGTTVSVVADYIAQKGYRPKAVILISDGYIESSYRVPEAPCLWGIVDNPQFVPLKGKVLHIESERM